MCARPRSLRRLQGDPLPHLELVLAPFRTEGVAMLAEMDAQEAAKAKAAKGPQASPVARKSGRRR